MVPKVQDGGEVRGTLCGVMTVEHHRNEAVCMIPKAAPAIKSRLLKLRARTVGCVSVIVM